MKIGTRFMKKHGENNYHVAEHERGRGHRFYLCDCMPRLNGKFITAKKILTSNRRKR